MLRVTGSEIKIHMGVSIFRENVRYYVFICRIKTSKNSISILLLFTVKRIWSFKELSSV